MDIHRLNGLVNWKNHNAQYAILHQQNKQVIQMELKSEDSVAFEERIVITEGGYVISPEEAKEVAKYACNCETNSEFIGELRRHGFSEFKIGIAFQIKHENDKMISLIMKNIFEKGEDNDNP